MRNRIRYAIGRYEDLLTTVKKRKLRWHGHITRSTGLAKMIPTGHCTRREKERQTEKELGRQRNERVLSWAKPFDRLKIEKNGEKWLPNHPWCPNGQLDYGISEV